MTDDTRPDWMKNWQATPNRLADRTKPVPSVPKPSKPPPPPKPSPTPKPYLGNPNWKKGMASPNPAGRPPNITIRKSRITEQLLDNAGAILEVMVARALEGDAAAAALVVNRVVPTVKPQLERVEFTLDADASISKQVEQVLTAISKGEVAVDVGQKIITAIQALASVRAVEELEQRIVTLEEKQL